MNAKAPDDLPLTMEIVESLFHKLGQSVGKRHIDKLSHFLKVEGKLRGEIVSFPSGFHKIRFNVHKGESYEFICNEKNERQPNVEYTIIKYPGFTLDPLYEESAMGNVVGIPSDKRTRKYYDRRKH